MTKTRVCGHSGFRLALTSDSSFQNGGLNERSGSVANFSTIEVQYSVDTVIQRAQQTA